MDIKQIEDKAFRFFGSDQRLRILEDEDVQAFFTNASNDQKVELMKTLWTSSDLPAKQLATLDFDPLEMIEPYAEDDEEIPIYRIYLSEIELDEGFICMDDIDFDLRGSWTTSISVATFFSEHVISTRYQLMWKGKFPKYAYLLIGDLSYADILWTDDSRNEAEVAIKGFCEETEGISIHWVVKPKD